MLVASESLGFGSAQCARADIEAIVSYHRDGGMRGDTLSEAVGGAVPRFLVRRLILDVGGYTEKRLGGNGCPARKAIEDVVTGARQRLA